MTNRAALLFAFAFAVMADPVSSVSYAIEAALRALRGDLALLLPTMGLVVAIIAVVIVVVLICGLFVTPGSGSPANIAPGHSPPVAVALAFPVAMALATGIEAPSSAIAQLGELDDADRRRFGRITLWLTLLVVGTLTLGLTAELVHLRIGVPPDDSTQIAELARVATAPPLFAAFQLATALLLLSAASSSFQAGPGLLKALARKQDSDGTSTGILPAWLGRTNSRYTPYWGVAVFMIAAGAIILAARGRDQELVLFYAAAVFVAFHAGLVSMCRFSWQQRQFGYLAINLTGTAAVSFTLVINVARGEPIVSIGAALLIAAGLYALWVRSGRPRGIRHVQPPPPRTRARG